MFYPEEKDRIITGDRKLSTAADIEFGLQCLEGLLQGNRVRIGTPQHPSRPASGGIIDVFADGAFLSHRRDGGTPVHPWYNGIPSGFPSSHEHFDNIRLLQQKEGGEESIVMYDERIILPVMYSLGQELKDLEHPFEGLTATRKVLTTLGMNKDRNPLLGGFTKYCGGSDILEIKDAWRKTIRTYTGAIYLSWEVETNVAIAARREWLGLDSSYITAFDGEGFYREGQFVHLNREKFLIRPEKVANVAFGQEIPMPRRYKLRITEDGLFTAERVLPSEGERYQFKPDDGLRRMLDDLKVPGWHGKWIQYEIAEAQKRLGELQNPQTT